MLLFQVALVSQTDQALPEDVAHVAAALQKQVTRDLAPLWGVSATVDVFPSATSVPVGYAPVLVVDDVQDAAGFHTDDNGQPFALVEYSDSWSLTASHEVLEMLCDPWGSRTAAGRSPKDDQGQIEFLVEACDACEAAEFAYTINGVIVSDFVTPKFYDPKQTVGARYSFTGAITTPREVLAGGYISWWDPVSNHIWQYLRLGEDQFRDLGEGSFNEPGVSLREYVDRHTDHPDLDRALEATTSPKFADAQAAWTAATESARARGERYEASVAKVMRGADD
jgi:hypothetical protein